MKYALKPHHFLTLMLAALAAQGNALAQEALAEAATDGTGGALLHTETKTLTEGEASAGYSLGRGSYLVELSSTGVGGGAKIEWTGAVCPTAEETKYYRNLCVLPKGGELRVSNPAGEWKGNEVVSVIIKRYPITVTELANNFTVVNEVQTLAEGSSRSFTLNAGNYRAEVLGSRSGVKVEWEDPTCSSYSESKNYLGICKVAAGGRITISNPPTEWKGDENTTIVIRKVGTSQLPAGTVVVDETQEITETTSRSFKFSPGVYRLTFSGVKDGMNVSWSKKSCPSATNITTGRISCNLATTGGTLTLTNPDVPWWTGTEKVNIKVVKTK